MNEILYPTNTLGLHITGFWGVFYGTFVAVIVFGLFLWRSRPSTSSWSRTGRWLAVGALGIFGALVMSFTWGTPLLSLEGAWIYPLWAGAFVAAATLVLRH